MPEASLFERTYKNLTNNSRVYTVGAATNLNLFMDLKYIQEINLINYNMTTEIELGHYSQYFDFETDYDSNFLFIGKNNKVIGKLDKFATDDEMEKMFNLTLASFEGIYERKPIENIIMYNDITTLDLNDYFYIEEGKSVEFEIISNSNNLAATSSTNNRTLELYSGDYTGSSKFTIQVKVPGKDIAFNSDFYVFNSIGETEDFEYNDLSESSISWVNDREKWFTTEESSFTGSYSLRSGGIMDDQSTKLSLTMDIAEQDFISFAYKTSSEGDNDILNFYVDSTLMNYQDATLLWSGSNDWRVVMYNLRPGVRTFTWEYSKNYLGSIADDCVWIDALVLPRSAVGTGIENNELPSSFELSNYPNPFNPTTTIRFSLDKASNVELNIYDMNGSIVDQIHRGFTNTGKYSFEFDGKNLSSGIYYAVLKAQEQQKVSKMILVK